ncbi:MAG: aldehyde dehydrogenase family protein, partial [Candidatus Omnitrophota bacterium]
MEHYHMFIGGEFVENDPQEVISSINPSTGEEVAWFNKAGLEDCRRAISAARKAFDEGGWPRMSFAERSAYLLKIAQLVREKAKALAEIESKDTGKTIKQTTFIDVPTCASCFEYFAGVGEFLEEEKVAVPAAAESRLLREPAGVVAAIIPWNYPLIMAAWKIAPAIAAGNTVVFKPSQLASLSCLELAEIFSEVGLPPGVVNIITGEGKVIGPELAASPQVDMLSFTGSTEVGKEIMRLAAANVKKIHLELGGKSPNIVFSD